MLQICVPFHLQIVQINYGFYQKYMNLFRDIQNQIDRLIYVQESQDRGGLKDLRSRGLCLVPISCTQHVGNDNIIGADYWAPPPPALGGGF